MKSTPRLSPPSKQSATRKMSKGDLVYIESPFRSDDTVLAQKYKEYIELAMRDCLEKGEFPFASHLMYTTVLNDNDREERRLGMKAGEAWSQKADLIVVYQDYGTSQGMLWGIENAEKTGHRVEYRTIRDLL